MLINELKKGVAYMQIKNKFFDSVKKVVENEMKISANSKPLYQLRQDALAER